MDVTSRGYPIPDDPRALFLQLRAMLLVINADVGGVAAIVVRETPTGVVNGVNPTFTLANIPIAGTEEWIINGILRRPGVDYTIVGNVITAITIPETGDWINASYRY